MLNKPFILHVPQRESHISVRLKTCVEQRYKVTNKINGSFYQGFAAQVVLSI